MKFLNEDSDQPARAIELYLTRSEANEIIDAIDTLLDEPGAHHCHVNNQEYTKELTVALVTEDNLEEFDARSRRLLLEDK